VLHYAREVVNPFTNVRYRNNALPHRLDRPGNSLAGYDAIPMRLLLRLVACLSLLVAVALLVLLIRSFWRNDSLFIERGPHGYFVASARGRVGVIEVSGSWHPRRFHYASYEQTDSAVLTTIAKSGDTKNLWILLSGDGNLRSNFGKSRWIAFPYLTPIVPCAALPAVILIRAWRRRRRFRSGLCARCGYDLRASQGRCPECGTIRGEAKDCESASAARDGEETSAARAEMAAMR
jgi:hypothetical protein